MSAWEAFFLSAGGVAFAYSLYWKTKRDYERADAEAERERQARAD